MSEYEQWKAEQDAKDKHRIRVLIDIENYWLAMHAEMINRTVAEFEALNPYEPGIVAAEIASRFKAMARHEAQMHVQRVLSATSNATVEDMRIANRQLARFGLIPCKLDDYPLAVRSGRTPSTRPVLKLKFPAASAQP